MTQTLTDLRENITELNRTVSRRTGDAADIARRDDAESAWLAAVREEYAPNLNDTQWDTVYTYAYQEGHSGGYGEIEHYVADIADIATQVLLAAR